MKVRAVTLHDVEPATFDRCVDVRQWLAERGIERATLLVIPAARLHAFHYRSPELAAWVRERAAAGDAVAQHGLQHRRTRRAKPPRTWIASWQGGAAAEFPGLDRGSTTIALEAGRKILAAAGIEARGFVAPAFADTAALRRECDERYDWWATLTQVHRRDATGLTARALCLGTSTPLKRALSPYAVRFVSQRGDLLRVEVHPEDFDHPRNMRALERLLRRTAERPAVTYDELLAG
jgi:predicted deacetylase